MLYMIEKGADVAVDHRSHPAAEQALPYLMQGVMRRAARAATVGQVVEILLLDRLPQHRDGLGHDLLLPGGTPQRTARATALRDEPATHRLRTVRFRAEFGVSGLAVCFQGLRVRAPRHPVHTRSAVRGEAREGAFPQRPIHGMGERGARPLGIFSCLRGDPCQS